MKDDNLTIGRHASDGEQQCDFCGGNAQSTLGGEHIWKCSEIVPRDQLEAVIKELSNEAQESQNDGHNEYAVGVSYANDRFRELLEEYE